MKKFLSKIFWFSLPLIVLFGIELFVPSSLYSHRVWEVLLFDTVPENFSQFYPNQNICMNSQGDLAYNTVNAINKKECWTTNKLGFRNDSFIEEPDIIILGQSFAVGALNNQNETLANTIMEKSNYSCYSFAPASLSQLDYYLKNEIIKKPKYLVFTLVERNNPPSYTPTKLQKVKDQHLIDFIEKEEILQQYNIYSDRLSRLYVLKAFQAYTTNRKGTGIQSPVESTMYFLEGKNRGSKIGNRVQLVAETLLSYNEYCEKQGIKFIFAPMPDKESVYPDLVPQKYSDFLLKLDSTLKTFNIATINTLKTYQDHRSLPNPTLLYHKDDTHWNSNAVNLVSEKIIQICKK